MEKSERLRCFCFHFIVFVAQKPKKRGKFCRAFSFPHGTRIARSKWRYLLKVKFCVRKWRRAKKPIDSIISSRYFCLSLLAASAEFFFIFLLMFCTWNEFSGWWESFFPPLFSTLRSKLYGSPSNNLLGGWRGRGLRFYNQQFDPVNFVIRKN